MLAMQSSADTERVFSRVAWTRGAATRSLAELLAGSPPVAIRSDLVDSCISSGIDMLVARRLTKFDLVPTAVPHDVDLDSVNAVTIAAGDGPHTPMAVEVGARIAATLGVPSELATVYRKPEDAMAALERLEQLALPYPYMTRRALCASSATDVLQGLTRNTLLVIGAPGGSWMQRQLFGPGHRLQVAAAGGAVVVRSAPRRCFQEAVSASGVAVSPHLTAAAARSLVQTPSVPVADQGVLIGILRAEALLNTSPEQTVGRLMEPPVAVSATEPAAVVAELSDSWATARYP